MFNTSNIKRCLFKNFTGCNQTRPMWKEKWSVHNMSSQRTSWLDPNLWNVQVNTREEKLQAKSTYGFLYRIPRPRPLKAAPALLAYLFCVHVHLTQCLIHVSTIVTRQVDSRARFWNSEGVRLALLHFLSSMACIRNLRDCRWYQWENETWW